MMDNDAIETAVCQRDEFSVLMTKVERNKETKKKTFVPSSLCNFVLNTYY